MNTENITYDSVKNHFHDPRISIENEKTYDEEKIRYMLKDREISERCKHGITVTNLRFDRTIFDGKNAYQRFELIGEPAHLEFGEGCYVSITCQSCGNPEDFWDDCIFRLEKIEFFKRKTAFLLYKKNQPRQITLCTKSHGEKGKYRMDLHSNPVTYDRQLNCIDSIIDYYKKKKEVGESEISEPLHTFILDSLINQRISQRITDEKIGLNLPTQVVENASEIDIIRRALLSEKLFLIHGPPGTGKTTTLFHIIDQALKINPSLKILLTAESNRAVDNLVEKFVNTPYKITRIGYPGKVSDVCKRYFFSEKFFRHPKFKDSKKISHQIGDILPEYREIKSAMREIRNDPMFYEVSNTNIWGLQKEETPLRKNYRRLKLKYQELKNEISVLSKKKDRIENDIKEDILKETQIIACTSSNCEADETRMFLRLYNNLFDIAIFDEATQATQGSSWIPILKSSKIIFAGDHKQLPPVVFSSEAGEKNYERSLFELIAECSCENGRNHFLGTLNVQYRMNDKIMQFSNVEFYNGKIVSHESVADTTIEDMLPEESIAELGEWEDILMPKNVQVLIDTSSKNTQRELKIGTSYMNPKETDIILAIVKKFQVYRYPPSEIGIITPYSASKKAIKKRLRETYRVEVASVDGFQGGEKDIIVLSMVRENPWGKIGFTADPRRLNVALTRARKKLIIVGNTQTFKDFLLYKKLFEYVNENGIVVGPPNIHFEWQDVDAESVDFFNTPTLVSVCDKCGMRFTSIEDLIFHQKIFHPPLPKSYICNICGKKFDFPAYLKWHFTDEHGDKGKTRSLREQSFYMMYFDYSVNKSDSEKEDIFNKIIGMGLRRDFLGYLEWRRKVYDKQIQAGRDYSKAQIGTEQDIEKIRDM